MNGKCVKLHDVDLILDAEEKKARKERERRKRRYEKVKKISYTKENLSLLYKTGENELRTTEKNMLSNFTIRGKIYFSFMLTLIPCERAENSEHFLLLDHCLKI